MNIKIILVVSVITVLTVFASYKSPDKDLPANEAELGEMLFFDPILSSDKTVSCGSCHKPEHGFADNIPFSFGVDSTLTTRNTPTVKNVLARTKYFWDGRAVTLEEQALKPIENPDEMNLPITEAIRRLNSDPFYKKAFKKIFKKKANPLNLSHAIAAYEKTLESNNTAFDRYSKGDDSAMSEAALRGREIFVEKANCFECHFGPDFTQDEMINIGIYDGKRYTDKGLGGITGKPKDNGRFKVPGLRNVANTAPYMHNGMFATLREVIDFYNDPDRIIPEALNVDVRLIKPLNLTEQEKQDLEAFLMALSD